MKSFNYSLFSSLSALVIGILLVVWPGEAVTYLVITIGVLFLLPGLMGIFAVLTRSGAKGFSLPIVSIGSSLLGLWLILMPGLFVSILMYVLGALLILAGISQISNLFSLRRQGSFSVIVFVLPLLVVIAGLLVLTNPFEAASIPFIILGLSAIVYSLTDLFRFVRYKRTSKANVTDVTVVEEIKEE